MKSIQQLLNWNLLIAFLFIITCRTQGQDSTAVIPDGTEGEMLEEVKNDSLPTKWRDKRWRLFPGKFTTMKFGGGLLYEYAAFKANAESRQQMDSIGSTLDPFFSVRDFRVTASGQLKTKRRITWKTGFMYNGETREWLVRETGFMIGVPELSGSIFIGRTKEGYSLNKVMVGYFGWTMERQMAIDIIPILADGIKWLGHHEKTRIFWNAGIYTDWVSYKQTFSTYKWQWIARVGWMPYFDVEKNDLVHIAINYRYGEPKNGEIKVRSRPEVNDAPYFIDTGIFPGESSNHIGWEIYYKAGSLMLGSEAHRHQFTSTIFNNPAFYGGELVLSYILTGESRPYHTSTSVFGAVPVNRPLLKGGPGAWEIIVRYSTYNLTDGNGGKFWRITPMINWYLTKDIRLELVYGYGVLDRFQLKGTTQFFQSRLQLTLL